jgi:hypothetical protein
MRFDYKLYGGAKVAQFILQTIVKIARSVRMLTARVSYQLTRDLEYLSALFY